VIALAAGVALATRGDPAPSIVRTQAGGVRVVRGEVGPRGPVGLRGAAGRAGEDGAPGPPGPMGAVGATGAAGLAGERGPTGATGKLGASGPTGVTGATGPSGATGITGQEGPKGDRGDPGVRGSVGPAGPTGQTGPRGPTGQGVDSFDDLAGLRCTTPTGAGSLQIAYDAANHATLTCSVAHPAVALVRVNEVETGTSTSAADEFVELVNAGGASADLGGWKLVYRPASGSTDTTLATIPSGTSLAAGAFYLFGGTAYTRTPIADKTFATGLASTGGGIAIRDANGTLVDSLGWGTATNGFVEGAAAPAPPTTASPGSSIVRKPDGHDTNDNSVDFTVAAVASPRASN
jgi:hypothetical protein